MRLEFNLPFNKACNKYERFFRNSISLMPQTLKRSKSVMKELLGKSTAIALVLVLLGLFVNLATYNPRPLIFYAPQTVELFGVKVPLIDEKVAFKFFKEPATIFIDSRKYPDYARSHVEGAIHLFPDKMESKLQLLKGMLFQDSRIILNCYGPDCDLDEKVASFMALPGYHA